MNKSTITAYEEAGQWKDMFKFSVTLADGTTGTAFGKSEQFRFQIGEEVEYMLNEKGSLRLNKQAHFGKTFSAPTPSTPNQEFSAPQTSKTTPYTQQELIIRQVSLKAAVDYGKDAGMEVKHILTTADMFNEWINGNNPPTPTASHFDAEPF
jgi:hypothetical protein